MQYRVTEVFYSLQGEGVQAGRPAVFVRFAGCNLRCEFCDTQGSQNLQSGRLYETTMALVDEIEAHFPLKPSEIHCPLVVFTGGEPMLQLDEELVTEVKLLGCDVALETNGTKKIPSKLLLLLDHVTVSPKTPVDKLEQLEGDELKLLHPTHDPAQYEKLDFDYFTLQPLDLPEWRGTAIEWKADHPSPTYQTLNYCLAHPQWRLSLQLHKLLHVR